MAARAACFLIEGLLLVLCADDEEERLDVVVPHDCDELRRQHVAFFCGLEFE